MSAAPWLDGLLTALGATVGALALQQSDVLAWLQLAFEATAQAARGFDARWLWLAWIAALAGLARAAGDPRR